MGRSDVSSHNNANFIILNAIKMFTNVELILQTYRETNRNTHSHKYLKFLWLDFTLTSTHCNIIVFYI